MIHRDTATILFFGFLGVVGGAVCLALFVWLLFSFIALTGLSANGRFGFVASLAGVIAISIGSFAGAYALLRRKLRLASRAFFVGVAVVWCGFWALCDATWLQSMSTSLRYLR